MSGNARRRHLTDANGSLIRIAGKLRKLEGIWADVRTGIRANTDGPRPTTKADPTAMLAMTDTKVTSDERQIDRSLRIVASELAKVERIITYWTTDLPAKAEELAALERAADPGCSIMAKVGGWEPVDRVTDLGGVLAEPLPEPIAIGSWARTFARRNGRLPTEAEARAHKDGRRVMVSA
jgi:hypothetical protein